MKNIDSTIAVSYNYIDAATLAGYYTYMKNVAKFLPKSAQRDIARFQASTTGVRW